MLVLVGTINEDESKEGPFYYLLKGDHQVLTHKATAGRNTCQEEQTSLQLTKNPLYTPSKILS